MTDGIVTKIATGIAGLDKALDGGVPENNLVLISGGAGVGKTTLCMQFLLFGARNGERGIYVSTEQNLSSLEKQAGKYGKEFKELAEKNLLKTIYIDITDEKEIFSPVFELIRQYQPKRLVIDSLSTFSEYFTINDFAKEMIFRKGALMNRQAMENLIPVEISEKTIRKKMLAKLLTELRKYNMTVFLITELPEKGENLSSDGISEFIADGVILLKSLTVGDSLSRTMEIKKMRYTGMKGGIKTYELTDDGLLFDES